MGYDLHITRKKNWDGFEDKHGPEISSEEWVAAVNADRDMRVDGFCEVHLPDRRVFRHSDPSIAVWTAWSHHGEAGDMAWFELKHGNVTVKNPDREIRRKMWRLAQLFRAKVQGDDNEFYDRFGHPAHDESTTHNYWRALVRHPGFTFIWGDPVGGDIPPDSFARFPTVDSISPSSPDSGPQPITKRVLNIVIPKGSGTAEQLAAIEVARERAKSLGVELVITEK
jgi:hypothetical protein